MRNHFFTRRLPGELGKTLPITESILALPLAWATHVNTLAAATNHLCWEGLLRLLHQLPLLRRL
jgi:hypothetical protein